MIEVTRVGGEEMLINPEYIMSVERFSTGTTLRMREGRIVTVVEQFEEIKKRLGLVISPRAETLAI